MLSLHTRSAAALGFGLLLGLFAQYLERSRGEPGALPLILNLVACGLLVFSFTGERDPETPPSVVGPSPPAPGFQIAGWALATLGILLSSYASYSLYRDWQGTPTRTILGGWTGLLLMAAGARLLAGWQRRTSGSEGRDRPGDLPIQIEVSLLLLVLVIGADFRFRAFGVFPPLDGFPSVEEAQGATGGFHVLRSGSRPWEWPVAQYASAASFALFGIGMEAIRGTAAALGLVSILPFYALVRTLTSPAAALFAAFLLAVSRWHVQTSWYMDNVFTPLPLFILLMSVAFSCDRRPSIPKGVLLGVCSGILLYAYAAFRVAAPLTLVFLLASIWRRKEQRREHGRVLLACAGTLLLFILPLWGIVRTAGPELYTEALHRSFANRSYYAPDLGEVLAQQGERIRLAADMFTHRVEGFFDSLNTGTEPLLDPFSSVAFVLGLGTSAILITRRHHLALTSTFILLFYGATTLVQNLDFRRLAILIPFVFVFTGLFAQRLLEAAPRRLVLGGLALCALLATLYNGHFLYRVLARTPLVSDAHRNDYTVPLFHIHENYHGEYVILLTPEDGFVVTNLFQPNDYDFLKPPSLDGQVTTDPDAVEEILEKVPQDRAIMVLVQRPFDLDVQAARLRARFPGIQVHVRRNPGDSVLDLLVCRIPARLRRAAAVETPPVPAAASGPTRDPE